VDQRPPDGNGFVVLNALLYGNKWNGKTRLSDYDIFLANIYWLRDRTVQISSLTSLYVPLGRYTFLASRLEYGDNPIICLHLFTNSKIDMTHLG
jgi:hypothetical protein